MTDVIVAASGLQALREPNPNVQSAASGLQVLREPVPNVQVAAVGLQVLRQVVYVDDFNDTPGTLIQNINATSGHRYTKHSGSTVDAIVSDEGSATVDAAGGEAIYVSDYVPQQVDYAVTYDVKVKTKDSGLQVGPIGRVDTSANTFIWGGYDADTDTWRIVQRVAGVETVIGTPVAANLQIGVDYEVSLEFDADTSTVSLYVDGRLKVTGTVTVTDIGKLGFKIKRPGSGNNNGNGGRVDNGKGPNKVNKRPIASFSVLIQGNTVTFTNASSDPDGAITEYDWDFGDGNTSTEENPIHIYQQKGKFNPTLTVTDNFGDTEIAATEVTIGGGGRHKGRDMWVIKKKKK